MVDPNQAWTELAEAVAADEWDSAVQLAEGLRGWLAGNGVAPTITGIAPFDLLVVVTVCEAVVSWEIA